MKVTNTQRIIRQASRKLSLKCLSNRARDETKDITLPTYIPETQSGSGPGAGKSIDVNQKK